MKDKTDPPPPHSADFVNLAERIDLDNRFRLIVSLAALAISANLSYLHVFPSLKPFALLLAFYTIPYGLVWAWLPRRSGLRAMSYVLSAVDFLAITIGVRLTGGLDSPFFYFYPIPFLIHALEFDPGMLGFDGIVCLLGYASLLWNQKGNIEPRALALYTGQPVFLCVIIVAALFTAHRFRKKDRAVRKGVHALQTMIAFLENLNGMAPDMPPEDLHQHMRERLNDVLKPLQVFFRLWIADMSWKTLRGIGEHAALRPGSPHHLPTQACPAFSLRQSFRYDPDHSDPCPSEQFNYAKHLCLPLMHDQEIFGVLFLGSYNASPWDAEDLHLFEMLAQSVGLTLHRKKLFEHLQEKMSELNFSFEVGTTALATFGGSTQGIDETTVHILDGVLSILKADRASLMLWDGQNQCLQTQWVRGGDFKIQSPMRLAMGEGMAGWALKTGEPYWAEYAMGDPHYRASAQPIHSLLCVPVYTLDRQPLGVINVVTTRSARAFNVREINFLKTFGQQAALAIENAQLHQKTRAHVEQLRELNQMKSQFLSLVSHDLRGPLTGVRGFCEVLKQQTMGRLAPAQMELLEQVERQVDLQERMVDDLLDLARMEKGKLSIHPHPTDIRALLREEVHKSQMEAAEHGITLSLSLPETPPFPPVLVDSGRIRQVIWNLIHNALKFTPEQGRVVVSAALEGDALTVQIEDTGVGLSAEVQERVFDKFFQISPGGSKGAQGLGLGLAICKEIILAHQGRIRAQSPGLGMGTTITFSIPIQKEIISRLSSRAA